MEKTKTSVKDLENKISKTVIPKLLSIFMTEGNSHRMVDDPISKLREESVCFLNTYALVRCKEQLL